jgi:formiminoglutamase
MAMDFVWQGRIDSEDGAAARRMHQCVMADAPRALIGFACDAGVRRNQGRPGAADGPRALRQALANLAAPVEFAGFADVGDIDVGDDLEAGQAALRVAVAAALQTHSRLIVLGGGHETAFGSHMGVRSAFPLARIGIINLDAHLDLRMPGAAGASSGTPFYQIRMQDPARFDYLCLGVAAESNTEALIARAQAWDVGMITDKTLIADPAAADRAISDLAARCDMLHLSICLDVLPYAQAPGVSAPAARGVPLATIERLIDVILAAGKPSPLIDIVELSPPHDESGMTARTAAFLVRTLLID